MKHKTNETLDTLLEDELLLPLAGRLFKASDQYSLIKRYLQHTALHTTLLNTLFSALEPL